MKNKIKVSDIAIMRLMAEVNSQSSDNGLWFMPERITEHYLQQNLRYLHQLIEDIFLIPENQNE